MSEKIFGKYDFQTTRFFDLVDSVERIEIAVWLVLVLLTFILIFLYKQTKKKSENKKSWHQYVEEWYEKGEYEKALNTLATQQATTPNSAAMKWWQGRCYFRMEKYQDAVNKFEEACLLEPVYRQHVKDYMAFIELNDLVECVEGYLK